MRLSSREFWLATAFLRINVNQAFSTIKVSLCNTQPFSEVCLKINNRTAQHLLCSCGKSCNRTPWCTKAGLEKRGRGWWRCWAGGDPGPASISVHGGRSCEGHRGGSTHPGASVHFPDSQQHPSGWGSVIKRERCHPPCPTQVAPHGGLQSSCFSPAVDGARLGTSCSGEVNLAHKMTLHMVLLGVCRWKTWGSSGALAHRRIAEKSVWASVFCIFSLFSLQSKTATLYWHILCPVFLSRSPSPNPSPVQIKLQKGMVGAWMRSRSPRSMKRGRWLVRK